MVGEITTISKRASNSELTTIVEKPTKFLIKKLDTDKLNSSSQNLIKFKKLTRN